MLEGKRRKLLLPLPEIELLGSGNCFHLRGCLEVVEKILIESFPPRAIAHWITVHGVALQS